VKALLHLAPRAGEGEAFAERVEELSRELREKAPAGVAVNAMHRLARDPFGTDTPYAAALELCGTAASEAVVAPLVSGIGARIDGLAHADLSTCLFGEDVPFVASEKRAPIRYQYLMRRNAAFSHASYLERYRELHARFGIETRGILGYVQFHVDAEASQRLAREAGLGVWGVDSVSELHLASLETFFEGLKEGDGGAGAIADEELFVDRARSWDFCSTVDWGENR
jgi:hypothetical protein